MIKRRGAKHALFQPLLDLYVKQQPEFACFASVSNQLSGKTGFLSSVSTSGSTRNPFPGPRTPRFISTHQPFVIFQSHSEITRWKGLITQIWLSTIKKSSSGNSDGWIYFFRRNKRLKRHRCDSSTGMFAAQAEIIIAAFALEAIWH